MKKRILPALLALCMVMSLLPVAVFADVTECEYAAGSNETCTFTGDGHKSGCPQKCTHVGADGNQDCTKTKADGKNLCTEHQAEADGDGDDTEDPVTPPAPEKVYCTCGCEVTANSNCTVSGKFEAAETNCAHDGEDETAGTRDAACKYAVCTNMDCTKYGKNALKTHTHDDVSAGNCDGGEFDSKKVNCAGTTHQDNCPKKCTVAGCSKTVNHDGKHETNTVCTNDAKCGMAVDNADAIAKHVSTCPALADATVADGKVLYTYEKTYDVADDSLTCGCTTTAHGHAATCGKALNGTYSISVTVAIDEALTEKAAKDAAAVEAGSTQIGAAKETALGEWRTAHTVDAKLLCDDCVKAIAAADTKLCTGTVGCTVADGTHKKDCLSLCTMSSTCKNSVGKSEAHQMWYRVELIVAEGPNTVKGTYADRADAVALLNDLRAAAEESETTDRFQLVVVHCPQAGVADSVMVAADETAETTDPTDPATPEVKAPEKAEDFADLKGDEWYAEELTALVEKGIFTGSLDDGKYSFNATGNVTGAELVVLLSRVAGEDLVTTGAEWNKAATAWAAEAGYTEGVDITTTGKLTRQDVILILWRAAGSPASEQSLEDFADAEGLEGDYLTAMKWAVEKEIIKGDGDTGALKAEDNITRAEMVAVLTRYSNVK